MRKHVVISFLCVGLIAVSATVVHAESSGPSNSRFYYKDSKGTVRSAAVIHEYQRVPIVHPFANIDPRLDPRLRRAATIAEERANASTKARCWRYVKQALLASGTITTYPKTSNACQAGEELMRDYGFKRLAVRDPYAAPVGAVLVYSHGSKGAGHVEIRTRDGFVSDFRSKNRCRYPLLAVYAK